MGFATIFSRAQHGLAAPLVQVEVHLAPGLPCFNLVGLPAPVVRESRERVRAALSNSGFEFPAGRITVNLAPVDLAKEGGRYDLPIALGLLQATGQAACARDRPLECYGELGLSGELKPVGGLFLAAIQARLIGHRLLVSQGDLNEVGAAGVRDAIALSSLSEVCQWLGGAQESASCPPMLPPPIVSKMDQSDPFAGVKGHWSIKRALTVAAAGGHSVLLSGPPGSGKSLLAARFPLLLPPLNEAEALEVMGIHSLVNGAFDPESWARRPYRAPHHSASASAIVGGGPRLLPGEISLAHRGILFLDELPEFDRRVLESLREPLESGAITLARVNHRQELPAEFQLLAAMNPCPCGHLGDPTKDCRCTTKAIERYRARISGPLLDRIDIRVEVPQQDPAEMNAGGPANASPPPDLRAQVCTARSRQLQRAGCLNARLALVRMERDCALSSGAAQLLERGRQQLALTGRGMHRVLRLARTIADLDAQEEIAATHLAEALQLRRAV